MSPHTIGGTTTNCLYVATRTKYAAAAHDDGSPIVTTGRRSRGRCRVARVGRVSRRSPQNYESEIAIGRMHAPEPEPDLVAEPAAPTEGTRAGSQAMVGKLLRGTGMGVYRPAVSREGSSTVSPTRRTQQRALQVGGTVSPAANPCGDPSDELDTPASNGFEHHLEHMPACLRREVSPDSGEPAGLVACWVRSAPAHVSLLACEWPDPSSGG